MLICEIKRCILGFQRPRLPGDKNRTRTNCLRVRTRGHVWRVTWEGARTERREGSRCPPYRIL